MQEIRDQKQDQWQVLNSIYTSVEVIKTNIENMKSHQDKQRAETAELQKMVHHLDKNAVMQEEFTKVTEQIFSRLKEGETRMWKIIVVVTLIASGASGGVVMGIRLMTGMM